VNADKICSLQEKFEDTNMVIRRYEYDNQKL
jgi:hypothetical protein